MLCPEQSGPQMRVDDASSWPAASHPASVEAKYGGPVPSTLCQGRARQHEPLRPIVLLLVTVRPAPRPQHGQGLVRRPGPNRHSTQAMLSCSLSVRAWVTSHATLDTPGLGWAPWPWACRAAPASRLSPSPLWGPCPGPPTGSATPGLSRSHPALPRRPPWGVRGPVMPWLWGRLSPEPPSTATPDPSAPRAGATPPTWPPTPPQAEARAEVRCTAGATAPDRKRPREGRTGPRRLTCGCQEGAPLSQRVAKSLPSTQPSTQAPVQAARVCGVT